MTEIGDPTPNTQKLIDVTVNGLTQWFSAEMRRSDERFAMFSDYMKEVRVAESKRLDAIRDVDATAVRVASDKALDTAATLATQVSSFNDSQRALVNATAEAVAKNLQQVASQINTNAQEQIRQQQLKNDAFSAADALIQKAQNESQGRSGISIPLLLALVSLVGGILGFVINGLLK